MYYFFFFIFTELNWGTCFNVDLREMEFRLVLTSKRIFYTYSNSSKNFHQESLQWSERMWTITIRTKLGWPYLCPFIRAIRAWNGPKKLRKLWKSTNSNRVGKNKWSSIFISSVKSKMGNITVNLRIRCLDN